MNPILELPYHGVFKVGTEFGAPAYQLFYAMVEQYHLKEVKKTEITSSFSQGSLEYLLIEKSYIDTTQWHAEDEIRDPAINPEKALAIKRNIDRLNQERTNLVESVDDWLLRMYSAVKTVDNARINTETPAWAIDRLSILSLKIYHMEVEISRADAPQDHRERCGTRLDILSDQRKDLCQSIDELLVDISSGMKYMRLYRQMKMYNDPALNPILYGSLNRKPHSVEPNT